jgi:hypothetical protein
VIDRDPGEFVDSTLLKFDPDKVEKLVLSHDANALTLTKTANGWEVADKPDVKVKSDAVAETLQALAKLRPEQYPEETDLKASGLEPPVVTVEIHLAEGNRVLHVGRPDGESKSRYARAPDARRRAVFLMSEADADKVARELSHFTK